MRPTWVLSAPDGPHVGPVPWTLLSGMMAHFADVYMDHKASTTCNQVRKLVVQFIWEIRKATFRNHNYLWITLFSNFRCLIFQRLTMDQSSPYIRDDFSKPSGTYLSENKATEFANYLKPFSASRHYLNQCWRFTNRTSRNYIPWEFVYIYTGSRIHFNWLRNLSMPRSSVEPGNPPNDRNRLALILGPSLHMEVNMRREMC